MSDFETIFSDDFASGELCNWVKEQHVPDGYQDFVARDGCLVMLDAGNRIAPTIPALDSFSLKSGFEVDWDSCDNKFSLLIHFAYDRRKRQGTTLAIKSDGKELSVSLERLGALIATEKLDQRLFDAIVHARSVDFEVVVDQAGVRLSINAEQCFDHAASCGKGVIALSRGVFIGELRMKPLEVATCDKLEWRIVWDKLAIPFAPINGMDTPIVWTVSARQLGDVAQLDVTLSGGAKDRENLAWFPYHCRYIDKLQEPYLRIESARGQERLTLSEDTLTLSNPSSRYFYSLGYKKPEWPLRRRFFVAGLDSGNAVLFCGYKAYSSRSANKHQAAGQSETVYECKSGNVVYAGPALEPGAVVMDLKSPDNKRICKEIPRSAHDYEKAVRFAQKNHYFSDQEACSFHIELFSRLGEAKKELRLEYRLENAFFEPLKECKSIGLGKQSETLVLDIERLRSEKIMLGKLKPGVYHLAFRLYQGDELSQEKRRAFEVSGKKICGPRAARLPVMFSSATELMGVDTDYFDPWKPDCVDVSHYIAIGASVMPHIAREKRLWELYKLYNREWFLWLTNRTAEDWDLARNRDLVEHCDYITSPNALQESCLVRLCCRGFYIGSILKALYDFAVANDFRAREIKTFVEGGSIPDKETFNELVETCFYQWVDFFCDRFLEAERQKEAQIAGINTNVRCSSYGPTAIYAGAYKTAHSTRYISAMKCSKETAQTNNGFFVLEDYPHACRYNINRGPFLLASIKMACPELTLYPEMYSPSGNTCPDGAVARAWPSVGIWPEDFPVDCSVKRALEYAYAAIWHDGEKFNYWRDYGFHTRIWERARYEALLKTWGFVDKAEARRPLKANAFICNEACCESHAVHYDEYPGDGHETLGDLFNTAEESLAYAYEMSRNAGQNAGFVADFNSLATLNARDIDTLVLPPLTKVGAEDLANIRRLHEQGVSLLAFEEVGGLEDLFGVERGEEKPVNNIAVNTTLVGNPLLPLAGIAEHTGHRACKGKYRGAGADILLDGEVPVLFAHKTRWGRTALFNVPPTVVRRQDQTNRVCYGRDSISQLINESTKRVLRYLSDPAVETDAGKIIAFEDTRGSTHIIIEEDAHPMPARTIKPVLSVNLPGLSADNISCDKAFSIVAINKNAARIRLTLAPEEFAIVTIAGGT